MFHVFSENIVQLMKKSEISIRQRIQAVALEYRCRELAVVLWKEGNRIVAEAEKTGLGKVG